LRPCNAIAAKEKVAAIAIADKLVTLRQWQDFLEAMRLNQSSIALLDFTATCQTIWTAAATLREQPAATMYDPTTILLLSALNRRATCAALQRELVTC
jgi:formylglycine-generating enzyme required for sulfatase activity